MKRLSPWRLAYEEVRRHPYRTAAEFFALLVLFLGIAAAVAVAAVFLPPP